MLVRHVAVGEDDLVDVVALTQRLELRLVVDRDPVRVPRTGELGRKRAALDAGDLRRREGHHLDRGVVAQGHVEVVEVPTRGAQHDHSSHPAGRSMLRLVVAHAAPPAQASSDGENANTRRGGAEAHPAGRVPTEPSSRRRGHQRSRRRSSSPARSRKAVVLRRRSRSSPGSSPHCPIVASAAADA